MMGGEALALIESVAIADGEVQAYDNAPTTS
jgi:hypothetical protein